MSLGVRDDDAPLARGCARRTGLGTVHPVPARSTSKPQVRWLVRTQADCRALVELLDRYELRGRKRREYRDCGGLPWSSRTSGIADRRLATARGCANGSPASRAFRAPGRTSWPRAPADRDALVAYLHGLLCAEGSFSLRPTHAGVSVHLRQDDRPLLEMLARETGLGVCARLPCVPAGRTVDVLARQLGSRTSSQMASGSIRS